MTTTPTINSQLSRTVDIEVGELSLRLVLTSKTVNVYEVVTADEDVWHNLPTFASASDFPTTGETTLARKVDVFTYMETPTDDEFRADCESYAEDWYRTLLDIEP